MRVLILIFAQLASGGGDEFRVDASLALHGQLTDRVASEVRFTVTTETARQLAFRTAGGTPAVSMALDVEPGSTEVWMPVFADFRQPALSVIVRADEFPEQALSLDYVASREPVDALVGSGMTDQLLPESGGVSLAPSALPRYAPAYAQIASLAIDSISLAQLDDEQLSALLDFMSSCGRVLLHGANPQIRQIFESQAACAGRYLSMPHSGNSPVSAYRQLLALDDPSLLSAGQLRSLAEQDIASPLPIGRIAGFHAVFAATFLLLIARPTRRWSAIGLAIGATLLIPVVWQDGMQRSLTAWAEAPAEERKAQFASLEQFTALRRGEYGLRVDPVGSMRNFRAGRQLELQWSPRAEDRRRTWKAETLDTTELFRRGSFAVNPTLRARADEAGIVVCNLGNSSSRPAFVQRSGTLFEVPPLAPGEYWHSPDTAPASADGPELQLFIGRSAGHEIAILQHLPLSGKEERGWILRYESIGPEGQPC